MTSVVPQVVHVVAPVGGDVALQHRRCGAGSSLPLRAQVGSSSSGTDWAGASGRRSCRDSTARTGPSRSSSFHREPHRLPGDRRGHHVRLRRSLDDPVGRLAGEREHPSPGNRAQVGDARHRPRACDHGHEESRGDCSCWQCRCDDGSPYPSSDLKCVQPTTVVVHSQTSVSPPRRRSAHPSLRTAAPLRPDGPRPPSRCHLSERRRRERRERWRARGSRSPRRARLPRARGYGSRVSPRRDSDARAPSAMRSGRRRRRRPTPARSPGSAPRPRRPAPEQNGLGEQRGEGREDPRLAHRLEGVEARAELPLGRGPARPRAARPAPRPSSGRQADRMAELLEDARGRAQGAPARRRSRPSARPARRGNRGRSPRPRDGRRRGEDLPDSRARLGTGVGP